MADDQVSVSEQKKEDWMNAKWRPMMGWMYMLVCMMDFIGFPILWSLLQAYSHGAVNAQWQPLTLQGAGLFHIAMGAVIGISAYGRTQEKLNGANNGGIQLPTNAGTTYTPPPVSGAGFSSTPIATNAAVNTTVGPASFGAPPAASGPAVTTGFGGKPAPAPKVDPEI
jgi:hypothetical protein